MSGGGRCNFTNYYVEPNNYLSQNPHFCKSALSRYTQYDFLALVDKYQVAYHEKTLGQLFCNNKAKDILAMLLAECDAAGAAIHTECSISEITAINDDSDANRFKLATSMGTLKCRSLVIATGGLSIPTMGATGFGYDIAKQFGLKVTARQASLVPFTFKGEILTQMQALAGLSLDVSVSCNNQSFKEALLFTHKGLSGPAILQISNYWRQGDAITINYFPNDNIDTHLNQWQQSGEKSTLKNLLARHLPKRFVTDWLAKQEGIASILETPIAQLSNAQKSFLAEAVHNNTLIPNGTEGYKTAEVTLGGVDTDGVSSKTFEAKKVPGLFFIGEVLDVTGWLGGFNFQWAWASGYCAAEFV